MRKILITSTLWLAACAPASVIPEGGEGPIDGPGSGAIETVSIAYLRTLYRGAPTLITNELRISGALISSDMEGNFYQTMVLFDGTGGIELRVPIVQYYRQFDLHSTVAVRCNGLTLGSYGGTLQLGGGPTEGSETQPLSEEQFAEYVTTDSKLYGDVAAHVRTIDQLSSADISTLVVIDDVRFLEQSETWTEEGVDTNRHVVDNQGATLAVRTSRHATFSDWALPAGMGRISGIVSVFNSEYQIVVLNNAGFVSYNAEFETGE